MTHQPQTLAIEPGFVASWVSATASAFGKLIGGESIEIVLREPLDVLAAATDSVLVFVSRVVSEGAASQALPVLAHVWRAVVPGEAAPGDVEAWASGPGRGALKALDGSTGGEAAFPWLVFSLDAQKTKLGVLCLAGRAGSYSAELVSALRPFAESCARLLEADLGMDRWRKAEREAEANTARWRLLWSHGSDAMFMADADGRCTDANSRASELLGYSRSELRKLRLCDLCGEESSARALDELKAGSALLAACALRKKRGHPLAVEMCIKRHTDGSVQAIVKAIPPEGVPVNLKLAAGIGSHASSGVESPGARYRVLVIDDDPKVAMAVQRMLLPHHDVTVLRSGPEAQALLAAERFDAVICDVVMPGMSGIELYQWMVDNVPDTAGRFVFMTGGAFPRRTRQLLDSTARPCLKKPFDADAVCALLEQVAENG